MKRNMPLIFKKALPKPIRLRTGTASTRRVVPQGKALPTPARRVQIKKRTVPRTLLQVRKRSEARRRSFARKTLTTGVLRRNPNTQFALVDVANLSYDTVNEIAVQVFDWSSGSAVPLAVQPCELEVCKVALSPNSSDFLYADVSAVEFKYEVRITLPREANVLVNVTGVSEAPFTPQVGDNVLQHSLVEIRD